MFRIEYDLKFPTSVYHACEAYGNLYVAGSLWDRRSVLYTKQIAAESQGVLRILRKGFWGFKAQKEILFPHMVYTVTDLSDGRLFVALKYGRSAFTLIDLEGNIIKQRDDEIGNGSYGVIFDRKRNELILATRNGRLEFVDAGNLQFQKFIQVAPEGTRLWSLCLDEKTGTIYAGDYDGGLYVIEKGNKITKFNIEELYKGDELLSEGFKPAVWGLEITDKGILVGTRWGSKFLLDHDFEILEHYSGAPFSRKGADISCIRRFEDNLFLVGTRYGKIFPFDLTAKFMPGHCFLYKKPSLQKENAVWTMTPTADDGVLACFADGYVVKIVKSKVDYNYWFHYHW